MTLPKKRNVGKRKPFERSSGPSAEWASRVDVTTLLAHLEPARWFLSVLVASELFDDLRERGHWTVFVPSEEARSVYPEGALEALFAEQASSELVDYAEHHVARDLDDSPTDSEVVLALDGYAWQLRDEARGSLGTDQVEKVYACRNGRVVLLRETHVPTCLERVSRGVAAIELPLGGARGIVG
jgi:hypothetical protein